MSSSSSCSSKQDLKVENTSEIKEKEKKPITTPKLESSPQDILSENTIPACPNLGLPTSKTEKDTMQRDPPKDDDKLFICMKCEKEFSTSHIHKKNPEVVLERQQKVIKSIFLVNSREGGGSSSSNSPFPSFNGGSSSGFPLFNGGVITEMKTTMFSSPIPYSSISWHHRVPVDSYQGLYSGLNYGGGGSSSTNSKPFFGSGITRGVSSMFSSPTPNRFFTGSTSYYSSYGGSNNGSWVSGEVPREMIDLNKPPCSFVDLELEGDDKGRAKWILKVMLRVSR